MNGFKAFDPDIITIAEGLLAPEGPVSMADGTLIVCEMAAGRLTRIASDGSKSTAAETGGTPNGAAIGPDGAVYVCNRGKTQWRHINGVALPLHDAHDIRGGGSIQRVDLTTGQVTTLYKDVDGRELNGPNDIVFDSFGGFYFTDFGHIRKREKDRGSIFYAKPDGSFIREVAFPMDGPNGIGLSPDGTSLYVAETFSGHLYRFDIVAPGAIHPSADPLAPHGGAFLAAPSGRAYFDSLAVDGHGHVIVATIGSSCLTVASPAGQIHQVMMPDPMPTNLCFGRQSPSTMYVTLVLSGRLVSLAWPHRGLDLNY